MAHDKRDLTEKERKRKQAFEQLSAEMQQNGYQMKNVTIDIRQANFLGPLSMLPFIAITFLFYHHVNGFDLGRISWGFVVAAVLLLPLTILHELIHGVTWGIFAKNHFHSIDFGMIWSSFSPYCTCSEPLKKWQYLLGTAMPTLILGGGVAVVSVMTNQFLLFFLAEFMIISGGGDFLIILKGMLYRTDRQESVYCDHPYECGFVIFEK